MRRDYELPEAYHINGRIPELKGGLVLKKCDAEKARKIDLLLLSIGGNDIGFARLVANAVLADSSMLRRLGGWFGHVHGFAEAGAQLDQLDDRLKAVNRAAHFLLHVPWPESDRVILTGYPPMALLEDGNSVCPDGQAGMNVLPDFFLSEAKAREGNIAAERLHAVMQDSAKQHRWTLVEAHRAAFRGRGICVGHTDAPWTMADEMRLPRKVDGVWEPYNPSRMAALCLAAALVSHAQRCLHDGQLPRVPIAAAEGHEGAGLLLGAAAAGQRLFRRLPPHRRGAGGHCGRGRREGARGARQVRCAPARRRCARPGLVQ